MPPDVEQWLLERAASRHERLVDRLASISGTRGIPSQESIEIGSARESRAVILFADLVNSTRLAMTYASEPAKMLASLNVLIPTLQDCAAWYGGEFEKNTGDGILVYFGVGSDSTDDEAVKYATFAGSAMLWSVANIVNPELQARSLQPLRITIGADLGNILLARIGVARGDNPRVAVGLAANRAAKIQDGSKPDQFRVGEDYWKALPLEWRRLFRYLNPGEGWPFQTAKSPGEYEAGVLAAKLRAQTEWERQDRERRSFPRQLGGLTLPYIAPLPVTPDFVSQTRPYGVYLYL